MIPWNGTKYGGLTFTLLDYWGGIHGKLNNFQWLKLTSCGEYGKILLKIAKNFNLQKKECCQIVRADKMCFLNRFHKNDRCHESSHFVTLAPKLKVKKKLIMCNDLIGFFNLIWLYLYLQAPPLWRNSGGRRRFRVLKCALSWVRSPVAPKRKKFRGVQQSYGLIELISSII